MFSTSRIVHFFVHSFLFQYNDTLCSWNCFRHSLFATRCSSLFVCHTFVCHNVMCHAIFRSFRHVSTPIFIISGQLDMNSFNELTCGVKPQDPEYDIYSTGIFSTHRNTLILLNVIRHLMWSDSKSSFWSINVTDITKVFDSKGILSNKIHRRPSLLRGYVLGKFRGYQVLQNLIRK